MSTFIPPTPAATKSAEQHEEPSEQDSFNHLLFKVLRLTSEQVQDLNDWMIHRGTPNIHEVIVQSFRRPHALEDDLHFIRDNKTCYIKAHVMISLSLMITYIKHLRHSGKATHFGPFYYIQIDPQDYDEWRIETPEEEIHFQTPSKLGSPATPRSMATSVASESYITLTNFKKGIKRDASAYPIFKNERYYNTFIRHFKATAKAQGLNTLMDPNFTPGSDEYEQQLFQEQQDFLYSVLISSLKTDFSEALVKDHEGDAQLILELLHEHHTGNSQYSRSEINRITKYLTNIKLDDTWRGTNESFLMHYNDQLRLLDSLVDPEEKLPDNTRVTFLESAVESVPDLRRVKITDNVLQAQLDSTRPITYKSYFDLLKDAAFHLDQATKRGNKIRHTNVHFSEPNDEGDHQNPLSDDLQAIQQEDVCSEPPEPLSYSVFQSHFQGSSTSSTQKIFLPKHIWEKLSKDQQQMIIDHNRSLPKSGSSSILTPNKSPSPLPHKPTPQQTAKSQQVHTHQSDESTADSTKIETTPSDPLLAMVHQSIHPSDDEASDITKVLSAKRSRQIQVCKHYIFQHANHTNNQLVDRGANGGLAGSDMRVIYKTHRKINISGIDNHEVNGLDVVTAATLLNTSLGKVIGIFNEYAHLGKGSSIHSSGQLEWFKTHVDEKSIKVGGTQLITTLDGYSVPLLIKDGLAYATSLGRPTDHDMDSYPHVFFTSPDEWDPSVLDHDPPPLDGLDPSQMLDQPFGDPMFDAYGDFNERIIANLNILLDAPPEDCRSYTANLHQSSSQEPDWNALRPFFAWTSPSSIHFPSSSNEKKGYWVGFADNQGDSLTWRILTEDTQKIIIRSGVRSALRTTTNQRLASSSGEGTTLPFPIPYPQQSQLSLPLDPLDESNPTFEHFVNSQSGADEDNPIPMTNIDIPNLLGRSFLLPPEDNGERHMAKIVDIDDHGQPLEDIKFKLKIHKDQAEEIMSYNQLMDYIQKGTDAEEDPDSLFKFRDIVAHQGPLESTDPDHKGSRYNVMVEWESGEITYEPLALISKDDPITCAVYAKKHDLLDTTGWKHLKRYAKTSKRLIRAVKQSRIRQVRASARYQHGFQVPRDYNDAMRLDKENGNTHWQDAMDLELTQIHEYKVFRDTGKAKFHNGKIVTPDGFQKIRVHFVYAVKHDGRFKARLVADGHLTKEPVESIYSGVVSLRSLRMVVFLSQLNNLEIWGADVGNAYLEAYTDEKLCIMAGPEFKELQGHLLIMVKALYGTRSGGARWHDRLFDILQELKFKPSKADPDVWMRPEPGGTCYEYIAVYVDDLAIAAKDPQAFCNELKKKYNLKLKGVGPLEYHLGCTYKKDPDGTLAADPRRYVNKILESYERMFNEKPRKSRPPLEGGDHPELDTSELCDDHQTKQFQTLIGQLQWLISLGRFDIAVHVMSLSRFRAQPRKGHLDRAKRIVGYLLFLPDGAIRFRTGEPDFSSLKDQEYDWTRTVYSGACEQIPHDIPEPLGKHVQTTHYVDANLHHDLATGKAVTAVLHFLNQTPIDAYTKRQSTVETATYGSEFVAARTAVDQIIDIRTTLRYLGVPIRDKSYMFGDNRSVVTSSTIPNSTISKRHHLASYHRVREAIAAKFISFHWKDGKSNPADILSKHWEFATVWPMLKPILFWRGETATQLKGSDRIPSTTPGAEPPRGTKDSGSARSHSTHLETSSQKRP